MPALSIVSYNPHQFSLSTNIPVDTLSGSTLVDSQIGNTIRRANVIGRARARNLGVGGHLVYVHELLS